MKQITPVQIWKNGEQFEASILNAQISFDNLETACSFFYTLQSGGEGTEAMPIIVGQTLASGEIVLNGDAYLEWDGSNDYAYNFIANKLNLTIV